MFKRIFLSAAIFVFLGVFASHAYAHGLAVSQTKDVGVYTIEFEYENEKIISDETNAYVFRLLDQKSQNSVKIDSVLVRIENQEDKSTVLVVRLAQDELQDGVARLSAMLDDGTYLVTASFYKDGKKVAEGSYDLKVLKGEKKKKFPTAPVASALGGFIAGYMVFALKKGNES